MSEREWDRVSGLWTVGQGGTLNDTENTGV